MIGVSSLEKSLLDLIEIDSPTGGEKALAVALRGWLEEAGWRVRQEGLSLVADRPQNGPPQIGFFGHLDVVTDREMAPISVDETYIYGPGTCDMKGGLAVMLELARSLPEQGLRAEPVLVFYDAEEGPIADNGLAPLLDAFADLSQLELGICMEPTANQLQLGCVGSLHVRLTVEGKAGHSARPWEGDNAITGAASLLAALHRLEPRPSLHGGLTFFDTTTVTLAQGGKSRNSVPSSFQMNVNLRFVPGRSAQQTYDEFYAWVDGRAELEWLDDSASAEVAEMSPLLASLVQAGELQRQAKQAWTDVAQLDERGIPGINFGPGDPAWAHQAGECIKRRDLARSFEVVKRWLCVP
ncbi:MAG: succinyl-diaminopimelate desuccinylase [Myxococcota bacterium]|nr:succinyl-diaminopimelate desuccinylase [Myxococcota bacterium]